ncbi:MAG: hypothetical protein GC189_06895 [Alphaproteobacteria bacterium]|nr:hypothetical protein [Alphaproteobacteria bacterium]
MSAPERIAATLERAIERGGDPEAAVYAALYARHPDTEALFVLDKDGGRRTHMFTEAIEVLIDLAGANRYGGNFLHSENINHEALGVSRAIFPEFFALIRDVVRAQCAETWDGADEDAWTHALDAAAAHSA